MDQIDRYVLGLAVLEGDRDARRILADLLEEQGDRGLAQWARGCPAKSARRLDFIIMLLPCPAAIRLGCDFLSQWECKVAGVPVKEGQLLSACVIRWLQGEIVDSRVVQLCQEYLQSFNDTCSVRTWVQESIDLVKRMEDAMVRLIQGVEHSVKARFVATLDMRVATHWETLSKHEIRHVARLMQYPTSVDHWGNPVRPYATIANQIQRATAVLNHLISPAQSPWPQ